jgi:hypothetical protein
MVTGGTANPQFICGRVIRFVYFWVLKAIWKNLPYKLTEIRIRIIHF